jgi:ketosteroid isomerase-like protein
MKMPLLITIAGLAIGFAVPALAEEKDSVDPEVRQQIEAELIKYDDAFNKHDAVAIADLFAIDAVEVMGWESEGGAVFGQQAIEKRYAVNLAGGMNNHDIKLVQAYPIGSEVCAITKETVAQWSNSAVRIYVRDADTWKIKLAYVISTMTH